MTWKSAPPFSAEIEGLNLNEQGALFICENCTFLEEMDLRLIHARNDSINGGKFFFGRQIVTVSGHFENLRKFYAGRIDWNSFLQMWQLLINIIEIGIKQIVPMFAIPQHQSEEHKILTVADIQDLFRLNKNIKNSMKKLRVNSLWFDTIDAATYFLLELSIAYFTATSVNLSKWNSQLKYSRINDQ